MNALLTFKRPFIWLYRFRQRRGYGVHSPFAFELITSVINEHVPYYAYHELAVQEKKQAWSYDRKWKEEPRKLKRLLFRLVNRMQPTTIVDAGTPSAASLYLKAGKVGADYTSTSELSELFLETDTPIGLLYIHDYRKPCFVEEVFRICVERTNCESVFVVYGIHYSCAMKRLWKQIQLHEKVGVTFDLYDVGILFFDRTKIKQSYTVNF